MQRGGGRENARRGAGIADLATGSVAAIVAAGGRGERARGSTLKQFQELGGRPLVEWSIDVLADFGCDPIILVVPPESVDGIGPSFAPRCVVIGGGDSRQHSVRNGLQHVTSEYVVVHDAARPFVTTEMVDRTLSSLADAEGAIVATPLDETLKRVDGDVVDETLTRAHLWRVQTPQSFRTRILLDAHDKAAAEGFEVTDDASLVERYGGRVVVVHSTRANMKLTYPEDFVIAEAMLKSREQR